MVVESVWVKHIHGFCQLIVFLLKYRIQFFCRPSKKAKEEPATTQVSSVCKTYIEPSAIALYDYEPTAMDDLSFNVSDFQCKFLTFIY